MSLELNVYFNLMTVGMDYLDFICITYFLIRGKATELYGKVLQELC